MNKYYIRKRDLPTNPDHPYFEATLRLGEDNESDYEDFKDAVCLVEADQPNLPITKAGRIQMILDLCYPVDEDGNPLEPLLTKEEMLELLNDKE